MLKVSSSILLAMDQKGPMKANVRAPVRLIISFFISLFKTKNKINIVSEPNIAETKLSLYAGSPTGIYEKSFENME